jgi:hypothetical protein
MIASALLKGVLLGVVGFTVFTVIYWMAWFPPRANTAVGLAAVKALVTHNPLYWTIGGVMIVLGFLIMLTWPVPVK